MKSKKIIWITGIAVFAVLCVATITGLSIKSLPAPDIFGCKDIDYIIGKQYPDLLEGVTATDYKGRSLTEKIIIDDSLVNHLKAGSYKVSYTVIDKNKKITTKFINFNVTAIAPYFAGLNDIYHLSGNSHPDYLNNVHAFDSNECNIDSFIQVDYSKVDLNKAGIYTVFYSVTDSYGISAISQVNLHILDSFKPYFKGLITIKYVIGSGDDIDYLNGINAFNYKNEDITKFIIIDDSDVDLHNSGEYIVFFTVTDSEGNTQTVNVTVQVINVDDQIYPLISGIQDYNLSLGEAVPNWQIGVSAYDYVDFDITGQIIIDASEVDINKIGDYCVYYSVENSRGYTFKGKAKVKVRALNPDINPPIITGTKDLTFIYGGTEIDYFDGVQAIDDIDGDITSKIEVDVSNVNLKQIGKYTVLYSVKDNAGNETKIDIIISVIDGHAPVFYNVKSIVYVIGNEIPDYITGVTARDDVDGDITFKIQVDDSEVDYGKEGVYTVIYRVIDEAGNTALEKITVTVLNNSI